MCSDRVSDAFMKCCDDRIDVADVGDYFNGVNTVKNVSKVIFVNMALPDKFRSPPQANGNA